MAKNDFVKDADQFLAPARSLNELALSNASKLVDLQLGNARKYTNLMLDSLKRGASVKDADGVKTYMTDQVEVLRKLGETLTADSEALMNLGRDYAAEAQEIAEGSLKNMPNRAA